MTRRRDDPRETVKTLLRLERISQEAGAIRASRQEREQLSKARAMLRLKRLKQEFEGWKGHE